MEDSSGKTQKHRDFTLKSVSSFPIDSPATARFHSDGLHIHQEPRQIPLHFDIRTAQLCKASSVKSICFVQDSNAGRTTSFCTGITIEFQNEEDSEAFHHAAQEWKNEVNVQEGNSSDGTIITPKSKFDEKIDPSSSKSLFLYYGLLRNQQIMLQDSVRTGTYYTAVMDNRADFNGRIVVDVGAGSGILSLFAAEAGAKHVYAVEASEMAEYAEKLVAGNPTLAQRITVIKGKVEDVEVPEKADILISEPMGILLVNERMLESYVIARDRFLTPNGKMFPALGRIHMAPFCDKNVYNEINSKTVFWEQPRYGVDLTPLYETAFQEYFSQPVVDAFDPRILVAPSIFYEIDFTKIKEEELYEISISLNFKAPVRTRVDGLACWFDVLFDGSTVKSWLTTAPGSPQTHWDQLLLVLSEPIVVMAEQEITGKLHMIAHNALSYTMSLTLSAERLGPDAEQGGILQTSSCKLDLKRPCCRMSRSV